VSCLTPSKKENDKKIVVYGAKNCIPCERALSFLDEMGIKYDYIDIDESEEAKATVEILEGGDLLLPLIINPITDQIAIGCPVDKEKFQQEIRRILSN